MSIAKPQSSETGAEAGGETESDQAGGETRSLMAQLFAPIEQELAAASERLRTELRHSDPFVDELAQHSFRIGGKRLRPALLLLVAKAVGEVNDSHHVLAAVVEMVHTATLVHDDILDEADIRRHVKTANARWGNQTSVLLGDYLFTHAFYLASTLETTYGCRSIGQATNIVCEGELRQTNSSGNFELPLEDYYQIIEAKTAELCACCCRLGAHYAGASEPLVESLEGFGRHLGIAFQIADDLLDLEGDESVTGKSLGTDLGHCKMTLPLIHLRDQLEAVEQQQLRDLVTQPTVENRAKLLAWLVESGSLQHTREMAEEHVAQAIALLDGLADSPSKSALLQIAQFVAFRES